MSIGNTLLLEMAGKVDLDEEVKLFKALGKLGRDWTAMAKDVDGVSSAIELLRVVVAAPEDASVAAMFQKVDATDALDTLKSAGGRLTSLLEDVPKAVLQLLDPIGRFDESKQDGKDRGLVRWPLLDKTVGTSSTATGDAPSYALSCTGNAALMAEAGDTWPYNDAMLGPLLRIRVEGNLVTKGSATLPFSVGTASGTLSTGAACALEYYFAVPDQSSIYAMALCERVGHLPDPFDFDSVFEGFSNSDLAGVHYEFDGSAALNVSVSVADTGALAAGIKADLGATIKVGFGLAGKYYLTFRASDRGSDGKVRIIAALSRERRRNSELSLKLGATVDLAALATKVHAILANALGEWDDVLKEIKPFLSPGTWLRDKAGSVIESQANELIKDKSLRDALASDLQGVIGVGTPDDSALTQWLSDQLTGAMDRAQGWAIDKSAAADKIVSDLGRLLPSFAQAEVQNKLKGAAGSLVGKIADDLTSEVDRLFTSGRKPLGKALKKLNAVSNDKVADADAALAGVRELIVRYDALFGKILAATEDAARSKVSIAVQISEAALASTTMEIEGTFLNRSDVSREIFRALISGEFTALLRLLDQPDGGVDFMLDPAKSNLKRFASRTGKFGVEFVALGFGVTGSELFSAEAGVFVDGTGKVQVDAKARLEKRFEALDAEREIELISSYSLVQARALETAGAPPSADRSLGLALTISHIDNSLQRHEVERFVGSLVDASLIDVSARETARSTFNAWIGNAGENGKLEATLQLKLALDRTSLSRLLGVGGTETLSALTRERRTAIVRQAFDLLKDSSADQRPLIDKAITFLAKEKPKASLDELLMDESRTHRLLLQPVTGSLIPRLPTEFEPFDDAMSLAHGLLEMIEQLRKIYFSKPEERRDSDPLTWSADDYRDAERKSVKAMRGWLQLNNVLFWTDSKVHPRTIAFVETLATLSGLDPLKSLSLTMWRKSGAQPETIVISHAAQ
jgi:hypothetical protein